MCCKDLCLGASCILSCACNLCWSYPRAFEGKGWILFFWYMALKNISNCISWLRNWAIAHFVLNEPVIFSFVRSLRSSSSMNNNTWLDSQDKNCEYVPNITLDNELRWGIKSSLKELWLILKLECQYCLESLHFPANVIVLTFWIHLWTIQLHENKSLLWDCPRVVHCGM